MTFTLFWFGFFMYLQETEKSFLGYRTLAKIVYKPAMHHKSATTNKYTTINKYSTLPIIARFMCL
jgi:hypothetical protein